MPCRSISLILLALVACRSDSKTEETARTASPYTVDSPGIEGTHQGTQLEAPQVIPAVMTAITTLESAPAQSEANLTSYKQLVSQAIDAMEGDLTRAGIPHEGRFAALRDSVLDGLGGGTGKASEPDPEELPRHTAQVRELIRVYQNLMAQTRRGA